MVFLQGKVRLISLKNLNELTHSMSMWSNPPPNNFWICSNTVAFQYTSAADTLYNNGIVITSKRCHCDVITSNWHGFDDITTLLLRHAFGGLQWPETVLSCFQWSLGNKRQLNFVWKTKLLFHKWVFEKCIISCIIYHISHIISYHIISYHIISYHIISYHIISYHIISCIIIISYHIISYHIISYHIIYLFISCCVVLCHTISCQSRHIPCHTMPCHVMSCHPLTNGEDDLLPFHIIINSTGNGSRGRTWGGSDVYISCLVCNRGKTLTRGLHCVLSLKTKHCQMDNFVIIGGTVSCHYDNLSCPVDNVLFSVMLCFVLLWLNHPMLGGYIWSISGCP